MLRLNKENTFSLTNMSKGGRAAVARSRSIDHQLDEERERREKEVQILIIGGPGAGKSTFIKQLRLHYGDQFPQFERRLFHDQILQNVAMGLVHLIEHMERLGLQFETPEVQKLAAEFRKKHPRISIVTLIKKFKEENEKAEEICPVTTRAELTKRLSSFDVYNPEVPNVDDMHTLWADPAMQLCFERRNKFETDKLTHSSEYFLHHIGRICSGDYLASVQDILLIRWPTLGVQEHKFLVDSLLYRMIDVAGQRSLRKKWIHFFDEVTAVAFFVNLAAYDEYLEEDPSVNSLQDSLQAFIEISNSPFLDKTEFILFLNKKDIFASKIKSTPLSICFQEYKGSQSLEASLKHVKEQFLQNKPSQKQVYTHVSCAIDVPHMKDLLASVIDCIAEINLRRSKNY
ncbi:guanine nucleotide-binding protein G(o) subunit alpha-like isoform X2 [Physella acuta]|uniref:guanine nucleotide-binding protein G(o) subunit alpha-like isoform X2 n=1 Tax=Physella acuta TaxID=109671 RepID=UPI0027DE4C3F|nr:guanine nucleotide-binding protein G(o) subunit alpha-like isoform X2 [Physella acuta]